MLTQGRLKELLHYNHNTGLFTIVNDRNRWKAGHVVGHLSERGYIRIKVDGQLVFAHRLAFLYMEGYFPEHEVDHKNRNKIDNRWDNLRHATHACNMQNKNMNKCNKTGVPGVYQRRSGKYKATAKANGKQISLGDYGDLLEAALARFTWEVQCETWKCDHMGGELPIAISRLWPSFNLHVT